MPPPDLNLVIEELFRLEYDFPTLFVREQALLAVNRFKCGEFVIQAATRHHANRAFSSIAPATIKTCCPIRICPTPRISYSIKACCPIFIVLFIVIKWCIPHYLQSFQTRRAKGRKLHNSPKRTWCVGVRGGDSACWLRPMQALQLCLSVAECWTSCACECSFFLLSLLLFHAKSSSDASKNASNNAAGGSPNDAQDLTVFVRPRKL